MAKKNVKLEEEKAEMDMSPMIDCVFLLLIFFIVVSTQAEVQVDPKVKPTIASSSKPQSEMIARIVVNAYYDDSNAIKYTKEDPDKAIEANQLGKYVEDEKKRLEKIRPGEEVTLHLRCDRALAWKDIQKVKVAAAAHGVIKVNFASYQQNPKKP